MRIRQFIILNHLLFLVYFFNQLEIQAQYVYRIKADSVLVTNESCTAELIIENSTKNIRGAKNRRKFDTPNILSSLAVNSNVI